MNAHVLTYYRWQHFIATRQHRVLAMVYWGNLYSEEENNA